MANGRIDIYFHSGNNGGLGDDTTNQEDNIEMEMQKVGEGQSKNKDSIAESSLKTIAIQSAKQIMNFGIQSFGDLTGNYVASTKMQNLVSLGATALMMTQFPVGTIAGVLSIATSTANSFIEQRNTNLENERLYERSGNGVLDNSKGVNR